MATSKKVPAKKTTRGISQDRNLVAGGQDHEVKLVAEETHRSAKAVKKAIKEVGNVRADVKRQVRGR